MSVDHLLIHLADVQRKDAVDLGHGQYRDDMVTYLAAIKFRLSARSQSEKKQAKQRVAEGTHMGHALPGTDIRVHDVITNVVREDGSIDTKRYRVTGVHVPSIQHHLRLTLEEIQVGANA
jgi:hypothetical protein